MRPVSKPYKAILDEDCRDSNVSEAADDSARARARPKERRAQISECFQRQQAHSGRRAGFLGTHNLVPDQLGPEDEAVDIIYDEPMMTLCHLAV